MSSVNKDHFVSCCPQSVYLLFPPLVLLHSLGLLLWCWKAVGRGNILALFLISVESFEFLIIRYDVRCRFSENTLLSWSPPLFLVSWDLLSWLSLDIFHILFLDLLIWSYDFFSLAYWYDGLQQLTLISDRGILKYLTAVVESCISSYISFCLTYFDAFLLGTYIKDYYVLFRNGFVYHYMYAPLYPW